MTQRKAPTVVHGTRFVKKWIGPLGFGHFKCTVIPLPETEKGKVWGRSQWNIQEEWVVIEVCPDGVLPLAQVEALVLHELVHGILEYANEGDSNTEVICNRIARLVHPKGQAVDLPNEWHSTQDECEWAGDTIDMNSRWVKLLVDGLDESERKVINFLFYEGRSVRATAHELGVSARTVGRIRLRALTALRAGLAALDVAA